MNISIVRYDESNPNIEALRGKYGYKGDSKASFTIIKNLLFINLHKGAKYTNEQLPTVYDGFISLSDGSIIEVNNSVLNCELDDNTTGSGILVLKNIN